MSSTTGIYCRGTSVELWGEFRDHNNQLVDPTTVRIKIKTPVGVETTYINGVDPEVENPRLGEYSIEIVLNEVGVWHYRFEGEEKFIAAEGTFKVPQSHFTFTP